MRGCSGCDDAKLLELEAEVRRTRESLHLAVRLKLKAQEELDKVKEDLREAERVIAIARQTRDLAQAASTRDLEARRCVEIHGYLEMRVESWVRSRIGDKSMGRRERALRLLEEAVELAQAEGVFDGQILALVDHVTSRPAGDPQREAGGVATCLLAWCAATDNRFLDVALAEIERNEAKPVSDVIDSLTRKAGAGLLSGAVGRKDQPFEWDPKDGADTVVRPADLEAQP